ncbi:MAG: Cof-type HAD-IIB family hydrolase [Prevotellaceae bacterium]|jgi:Cof subfamily protein (haloacid dehalogenase superfamily)|nr:Cof-type HAD-IIB family hydrolase [Prevotellaceae bacterium]
MKYKVLVLDIDGTLTNSQKTVTPKTRQALCKVQELGVRLVLASGRPTPGITSLAEELELEKFGGFILPFNGAKIIDCGNKKTIFEQTLPMEEIPLLYRSSQKYNIPIVTYDDCSIITEKSEDPYVNIEARINKMPVKQVDSFIDAVNFQVTKCLMVGEGNYLSNVEIEMNAHFGDRLSVYRSEPFFLEIMPQNIDKAYSLGKLSEHLGCAREEMIACGDGFNDLSMIRYAGLGVAMANAQPVVKESADFITLSNDEDGVAYVAEKFILSSFFISH